MNRKFIFHTIHSPSSPVPPFGGPQSTLHTICPYRSLSRPCTPTTHPSISVTAAELLLILDRYVYKLRTDGRMGEWNVLVTNDSISINKHLLRFVCSTPYRPPPPQQSIYNTTTRGAAASGCFTLILILLELVVVLMMILLPLKTFSPLLGSGRVTIIS